ncbi:hypothetical protein Tco_0590556 [Tanacetum coccineum]
MRTRKYGESNVIALENPTLQARNPVKEVLLKLNLPDHMYSILYCKTVLMEPEVEKPICLRTALGRLLEDIHVTWAHLKKKQTRLQLYNEVVSRIAHRA